MTTETTQVTRDSGTAVLVGAAGAAGACGLLVVALGALLSGSEAAAGALVGTLLVVGVFSFGTFVVNSVSALMPSAALIVAVLTYTLQVVALALVFVALTRSGELDDTLARDWLGAAVIVGTLAWMTAQVVLTTRRSIPLDEVSEERAAAAAALRAEVGER